MCASLVGNRSVENPCSLVLWIIPVGSSLVVAVCHERKTMRLPAGNISVCLPAFFLTDDDVFPSLSRFYLAWRLGRTKCVPSVIGIINRL